MAGYEEQLKVYMNVAKGEAFREFVKECNERLAWLRKEGYTTEQGIELLKLYAMQANNE
ncbi:MAG: hypothetical protein ACI4EX_00045 [Lachnospiraceae bacterium]